MPKLVQQSVTLPAPPERLYDVYIDPVLHAEFTGAPMTIGSAPGAEFRAFGDMVLGRVLSIVPKDTRLSRIDLNPDQIACGQFVSD